MALLELSDNPGPASLGRDPVIAGEARKKIIRKVRQRGTVEFHNAPSIPLVGSR